MIKMKMDTPWYLASAGVVVGLSKIYVGSKVDKIGAKH